MQGDIDEAFDSLFHHQERPTSRTRALWRPRVDIGETSEFVVVTFELPGVDRNSIELTFDSEMLIVTGLRRRKQLSQEHSCRRIEISYGPFERAVSIDAQVDVAQGKAIYEDGLLEVTLTKTVGAREQTIRVNIQ